MTDIKRVLAYSTISQLGYMMLALGVGGYVAAIFHLFTHAFFKALLFLGSGSVNHATNTFDMRLMGGLRKSMPITFWTFVIGSLSLSGVFPLAGFWSKDEILGDAWAHEPYLFWIGAVTAGLTAFYMFRVDLPDLLRRVPGGEPAPDATEHGLTRSSPSTPPRARAARVAAGDDAAAAHPRGAGDRRGLRRTCLEVPRTRPRGGAPADRRPAAGLDVEESEVPLGVAIVSTALALGGIALAWVIYGAKIVPVGSLARVFRPLHVLLENKYYLDVLYEHVIVGLPVLRGPRRRPRGLRPHRRRRRRQRRRAGVARQAPAFCVTPRPGSSRPTGRSPSAASSLPPSSSWC